ncbi:MAG TPA: hypothetical protein OIM12_16100 [Faecalibacterium prausnitzii]|jgi:hypothetical protein|nr:hypothetical protein [Faecalibacterium prausnitzii]
MVWKNKAVCTQYTTQGGGAAIFLRESAEKGTGELDKKTGVFVK